QYAVFEQGCPQVSPHKPSVASSSRPIARGVGFNALGVIMTGMSDDGARGLRAVYDAGSLTLAQDQASCVVFGMPREAVRHGGVGRVCDLDEIPELIAHFGRGWPFPLSAFSLPARGREHPVVLCDDRVVWGV